MTISPVSSLYQNSLQSIGSMLSASSTGGPVSSNYNNADPSSDASQLSPAAKMLQALQELQQQNPAEFKKLAADMSSHLKTEAATATQNGNTAQATALTNLAGIFQTASQTGTAPTAQALDQAGATTGATAAAHGYHHHHHGGGSGSGSSSNQTDTLMSLLSQQSDGSTLDSVAGMFASMLGQSVSGE